MADLQDIGQGTVITIGKADVGVTRERARRRRWALAALALGPFMFWLVRRALDGNPVGLPSIPSVPSMPPETWALFLLVAVAMTGLVIQFAIGKRSVHVTYQPSEIDVSFADVKGAGVVLEEVVKSINLFLAHKTFHDQMGGTPRRALLFEGPPGTGKTYMAKAMAREAGVPFLFVSSSAFQSMYYGATNRKIRAYFKTLRKIARKEGGAIGFIEEIDAIGAARSGMGSGASREGITGVVNELLIQLQSFDEPTGGSKLRGHLIDLINRWLTPERQIRKKPIKSANVLIIGATNRAADLDPALLRPGRFDRSIYFDLPNRKGRREIIDYYLGKKSHHEDLDDEARRDTLSAMTFGYTPVMIEHLLDEALVWAIRRGDDRLGWGDLQQAKMTEEIGLAQPVEYTLAERRTIATHESGHATVAHLVGVGRKLEVLSIIKRKDALGLLAHSDAEERYTRSRSEIEALIQIAMGGMVAEELFFGEISSGVAGDLQNATTAAAQMVGSFGMAGSLISYEALSAGGGAPNLVAKVLSSDEGKAKVEAILEQAKAEVTTMLEEHRHVIESLRDALLDRDELIGEEITDVIRSADQRKVTLPDSETA